MLLKSFAIAEKLGEIAIASVAAGNLGCSIARRRTSTVPRRCAPGAAARERLKHKDGIARANLNLGTILFEKARFDEAAAHFKESLASTELGLPSPPRNAVSISAMLTAR